MRILIVCLFSILFSGELISQTYQVSYIDTFEVFDSGTKTTELNFELSIAVNADGSYRATFNKPIHQVFYFLKSYAERDELHAHQQYYFDFQIDKKGIRIVDDASARAALKSLKRNNKKHFEGKEWKYFKGNGIFLLKSKYKEDFHEELLRELHEIYHRYLNEDLSEGTKEIDEFQPTFNPDLVFAESMQRIKLIDKKQEKGIETSRELVIRTVPHYPISRHYYNQVKSKFLSDDFDVNAEDGSHFHEYIRKNEKDKNQVHYFRHIWRYKSKNTGIDMFKYSKCEIKALN